jgi:hypothetical protein
MIPDVLSQLSGVRHRYGYWMARCPAHDDRHPSLSVRVNTAGFVLLKCHAGCTDTDVAAALNLDKTRPQSKSLPASKSSVIMRREDAYLDKIYTLLLSLLTLTLEHANYLHAKGLSSAQIKAGAYRSVPSFSERQRVAAAMSETCDLTGVPGFGLQDRRFVLALNKSGILIPVRSPATGLIVAIQVRLDRPGASKYTSLSSSWLPKGASSGARIHAALPAVLTPCECKNSVVWITEGVIKAEIAARHLGCPVWSVPGAANWQALLGFKKYLPSRVVIAYDVDAKKSTRKAVRTQARYLAAELHPIKVGYAVWQRAKGLDDALLAGERVRVWGGGAS